MSLEARERPLYMTCIRLDNNTLIAASPGRWVLLPGSNRNQTVGCRDDPFSSRKFPRFILKIYDISRQKKFPNRVPDIPEKLPVYNEGHHCCCDNEHVAVVVLSLGLCRRCGGRLRSLGGTARRGGGGQAPGKSFTSIVYCPPPAHVPSTQMSIRPLRIIKESKLRPMARSRARGLTGSCPGGARLGHCKDVMSHQHFIWF